MKKLILIIVIFIASINFYDKLLADVITLKDNSVINGRILLKKQDNIIIYNSYGFFNIKTNQVKEIRIDKSNKKSKVIIDWNKVIKVDISEKLKAKNEYGHLLNNKNRESGEDRFFKNFSIRGAYIISKGKLEKGIPSGFGITCTIETRFPFVNPEMISLLSIYLQTSATYYYFDNSNEDVTLHGPTIYTGPVLRFQPFDSFPVSFDFSTTVGATYLFVHNDNVNLYSVTFINVSNLGILYTIGSYRIGLVSEFIFMYDKNVNYTGIGFSLSLGYNF